MKIGILTYHAACNFGANLQVLSTVGCLRKAGHEPVVIDWVTEELEWWYSRSTSPEQTRAHEAYRAARLPLTPRCRTAQDIARVVEETGIEAVIVGSDAVLQHHPMPSRIVFPSRKILSVAAITADRLMPNPFWGSFLPMLDRPLPAALMSVSSQNAPYRWMSPAERRQGRELLGRFGYISVRDAWTARMVTSLTRGAVRPPVTPDPVFAFNDNVDDQPSEAAIREKYGLEGPYYLFSFHDTKAVSREWLAAFAARAAADGATCVALPFPGGVHFAHPFDREIPLPLDPLDWYALLRYAAGYVGHNMHPIVVCLHNAVPCFSFDNYGIITLRTFVNERSSKIYHIMDEFGLSDNRVTSLGLRYKAPAPETVYQRMKDYDREAVATHAAGYLRDYRQMMHDILQSFA